MSKNLSRRGSALAPAIPLSNAPRWFLVAAIIVLASLPAEAQADYIAASDFSASANPNGVWSYGQEYTLGGSPSLYMVNGNTDGIDYWEGTDVGTLYPPLVMHNGTSQAITLSSLTLQPGQLAFHPGPDGEYSVIRFTNPVAGTYALTSTFTGIDDGPTSTDVHVLLDGVSLFSDLVNDYGVAHSFSSNVTMNAGDILDFGVGYGTNGNFTGDSTGIAVQISPVSEPTSTVLLLGAGLCGAFYVKRRRCSASLPSACSATRGGGPKSSVVIHK